MSRSIRLFIFFAVGLLLGGLATYSLAETYPASLEYRLQGATTWYSSGDAACATSTPPANVTNVVYFPAGDACSGTFPPNFPNGGYSFINVQKRYSCVNGGTLSGTTCTKTCPSGEQFQPDGTCFNPAACQPKTGQTGTAIYAYTGDPDAIPVGGSYCESNCQANLVAKSKPETTCSFGQSGVGFCSQKVTYSYSYTGSACSSNQQAAPGAPETSNIPSKKPICDAGQGVLTSSSGNVACVPEGTPDARKPVVEKKDSSQLFPDGSEKKTVETKTTDPATQASDVTVSVTVTAASNGQPGQAGTPGTTVENQSSSSDSDGDGTPDSGDGDDGSGKCRDKPELPECKKGELPEKGSFGDQDAEIAAKKGELRDLFNSIKGQASALLGGAVGTSGGSLPCYPPITVLGRSLSLCFSQFSDELGIIGAYVMLAAALLSAFIVFRR